MRRLLYLLTFCSLFAGPASAWSCPFCPPSFRNSILQELDATPVAVLAELSITPREITNGKVVTGYRVAAVLRGGDRVKVGDSIQLPLSIPSPVGSVHLLLAEPNNVERWKQPRGLSIAARRFIREAALLPPLTNANDEGNRLRRLGYVLNFLDADDPDIARAAYGEFAAAPYSTVQKLAPLLHPRKLRAWIELERGAVSDRRLLFTLLAICGRPDDAEFVRAALDDRVARDKLAEQDGIIASYLTLAGPDGLKRIERELLEPHDVAPAVRRAAETALRFHADQESILDKRRIIASVRLLLDDPKSADYAIRDLARWKDWQSLDAILALQKNHAGQCPWLKTPIRDYLEACPLPAARSALASTQRTTTSKDQAPCKN